MMRYLGLGPVFVYEWLTTSRRCQFYAARSFLVAILGVGLGLVWNMKLGDQPLTISALAKTGESFFYALVGTQLALVLLAAPAYTAGSHLPGQGAGDSPALAGDRPDRLRADHGQAAGSFSAGARAGRLHGSGTLWGSVAW